MQELDQEKGSQLLNQMTGQGKIRPQLKTAGTGAGNTRAGLRPRSDAPGRSPGHMMPWAGRASLRAANSQAPYKKKAIPNAVRRAVALKYGCPPGGTVSAPCQYCLAPGAIHWHRKLDGSPSYWVSFDHELDHVHPELLGGSGTAENIVLACRPCNRRKGANTA
jgi:hypothetical protein